MTREIDYAVMDPTGNITILVETPVPEASQPFVAEQLMKLEPEAEQVGFLALPPADAERASVPGAADGGEDQAADITPRLSLRMAGGEFCGNASMSAAVYARIREQENGTAEAGRKDILLKVSGAEKPVRIIVETAASAEEALYRGAVEMPRPLGISEVKLAAGEKAVSIPAVEFEGITHLIIPSGGEGEQAENYDLIFRNAEALAPRWCGILGAEALGLMFLDAAAGAMKPLVYVPAAGTLVWENSCASGTTAVGAYFSERFPGSSGMPAPLRLRQPGGTLEIAAGENGDLRLTGTVRLLKKGQARIAL